MGSHKNWKREPTDFMRTKSSSNYQFSTMSSGNYPQVKANTLHNIGQSNFPRNASPSPLKFIKNQRMKTPMPDTMPSTNVLSRGLRSRSPIYARNMGHTQQKKTKMIVSSPFKSPFKNGSTNNFRNWNKPSQFVSKETNYERDKTAPSEKSEDEDRIKGNTFITIPKVKTSYNKVKKNRSPKFGRPPQNGHFAYQQSFNEEPDELRARRNPIINSRRVEDGHSRSMMSGLDTSLSKISMTSKSPMSRTPFSSNLKPQRSVNNFSHLDESMKLDFDVFDGNKMPYGNHKSKSVNKGRSKSKLQSQIQFQKELKNHIKQSQGPSNVYIESMFNIRDQMISKQAPVPISRENKAYRGDHKISRFNANSSRYLESKNFQNKSEKIIDEQKKEIRMVEIENELKKHSTGSRQNYLESILGLNAKLEKLKNEYIKGSKDQLLVLELKEKARKKEIELEKMLTKVKGLLHKHGLSDHQNAEIREFERRLSTLDLKKRQKKIRKLKDLEKKDEKYREKLETLDNEMDFKTRNVLNNKNNFVEEEIADLKEMLEEDFHDKFLIEKMKRMMNTMSVV